MQFFTIKDILSDKSEVLLIIAAGGDSGMVLSAAMKKVDRLCAGALLAAAKNGFAAKAGETLTLYPPQGKYRRILLIGKGKKPTLAISQDITNAVSDLATVKTLAVMADSDAEILAVAISAGGYHYHGGGAASNPPAIKQVRMITAAKRDDIMRHAAVGEGIRLARHLAEQPANIATPSFLAASAKHMARQFPALKLTVFNEKDMRTRKMGALLAVSQGSEEPPKMIVVEYKGAKATAKESPIVLVGKGVTFDTGGISLKPAAAMDEMKFDMCGAAATLGTMLACASMRLPLNVVAIIPSCENMPSGRAIKPGDVIKAMNGKTIEILNTDAEGRLILADALSYGIRYKPAAIIDVATLTGACVIALGHYMSGLMSNNNALAKELLTSGDMAGDDCWRLPLGDRYNHLLKSDYADMANIGGRAGGAITAACFLSHFVESYPWAHLDIAGTAWTTKKRATGRPVALLSYFLMKRAKVIV